MVTYHCATHGYFYVNKNEVKATHRLRWDSQKSYECPFPIKHQGKFIRFCNKECSLFSKWHNPKYKAFGRKYKKKK